MRKTKYIIGMLLITFLFILATGCKKETKETVFELNISAAASLTEALAEIEALYTEKNPNTTLTFNFGSSGSLQQQIEQGAPVDVFLSAAKSKMTVLQEKGLLLEDQSVDLLQNEVVLIAPKDSTLVNSFEDLTAEHVKTFAMGEPESVPAGKYAQEVLTYLALADAVASKTVLAKDVKEVLTWVESGDADAGMVYYTDALGSDKIRIVANAPEGSHGTIIYPVAVIKESKYPDEAKAFVEFLLSEEAKAIFIEYGFN